MKSLRKAYLFSLCILGLALAAIIYSIPTESAKYKETSRSEFIQVKGGWVLQMDLNNNGETNENYSIGVKADGNDFEEYNVLIDPESKFTYSYGADPGQSESFAFKVLQDGEDSVQEFYQKINQGI